MFLPLLRTSMKTYRLGYIFLDGDTFIWRDSLRHMYLFELDKFRDISLDS